MRHTFLVITVKMVKIGVHNFTEVIAKLKPEFRFFGTSCIYIRPGTLQVEFCRRSPCQRPPRGHVVHSRESECQPVPGLCSVPVDQ